MPRAAKRGKDSTSPRKWPALLAGCAVLATPLTTAVASPAQAAAPAGSGTSYVALGDSYAAGAGIPNISGGLCLRSDRSYGRLIAASLKPASYTDASCAAAKVGALTTAQTDAGIRVNGPQLDAVKPDTGLVTLTIGGNNLGTSDLGFVDVVAACSGLALTNPFGAPCRDFYKDTLTKRLDAVAPKLADGLQRIHAKAPGAKVLVVGYPSVVPDDPRTCLGKMPITTGDIAYLRTVLGDLNKMVAKAAAANDATYVDTLTPTTGHDPCSADPWIEPLLPGKPTLPLHPNATGERVRADAVLNTLRG
ncbi:SGNH/GDSL hydrolase family protein [Streptomyces sp. UNOB3_S3]|uniref:SGNH/GDSL hydrolase family protein n=1 Tax=Streptomyces sp. UNOB3_S3 TaxID=2871682 RepID=UPI001E351683|nr:SGNH/GDSL hydrolase family protein [Streptomyces sp. UNOB3_S3]